MHTNVMKQIKSALTEVLKLTDNTKISTQSKLKDDLGLDSMSSLTFLMNLEENIEGFVVDPDTLEMSDLDTVASIASYIENQLVESDHLVQVAYA